MKFSERWLREWVNPPIDTNALTDQLTFLGLEVDDVESAMPGFKDIVVARVVNAKQHPDADRLRVCEVDNGESELVQVVCGAPNVREGMLTALANVGGKLPDGTKIRKSKLRGVESRGMLCSGAELKLSEESDGILELPANAPIGTALTAYLELDDAIIDIDLTPDRGDCLSIRGIAREISAKNNLPLQLREINPIASQHEEIWPVLIDDASACVRFASRVVRDVDMQASSPSWMVERLRRSGVRSINPAVDITNYVMLELGQPMHAFDLDKLQGPIQVRLAKTGERLTLLDGRDVALNADTTVIADDRGAVSIAGIMGGLDTGVDENTKHVFFECALFLPELVIGKPRHYGCHTDSSHRYERGVNPDGQIEAIEYATGLLKNISGGKAGPVADQIVESRMPQRTTITVRRKRIISMLGIEPADGNIEDIFTRLGIKHERHDKGWDVTPPSYRYDLAIEEDYVEEVARVVGFDALPRTYPAHRPQFRPVPETRIEVNAIKRQLMHRGYQEVVTYSFVDADMQSALRPDLEALALANPISSELAVMRTTLIGGLLQTLKHNQSRQIPSMQIFETGLRFLPNPQETALGELDEYIAADWGDDLQIDSTLQQQSMLAGLVYGQQHAENWNSGTAAASFFSLKADVEALIASANGVAVTFVPSDLAMLHPGQRAGIAVNDTVVGYIGALSPSLAGELDLSEMPIVFELALDALQHGRVPSATVLSRFPQARRDIALLVDESVSFGELINTIRETAPSVLQDVRIFDVYLGDKLADGKKSIAMGLILQDFSRTLEDSEVERTLTSIVDALGKQHGAVLRV